MKKLYTFDVKIPIIEKVEEKTDEGVLMKEVDSFTTKVCELKLPGRKDMEMMRIIQSAEFGIAVGKGVQTRETMRTAILDNGGFSYAKMDLDELEKILPKLSKKRNEYQLAKIDGKDTAKLEKEFMELHSKVQEMEQKLTNVYEFSAETIADRNTVIWAVVNMTFWDDGNYVFPGHTEESRMESYYDYFDNDENHSAEIRAFSTAYIVYDAYLSKGISKEEIELMIGSLNDDGI